MSRVWAERWGVALYAQEDASIIGVAGPIATVLSTTDDGALESDRAHLMAAAPQLREYLQRLASIGRHVADGQAKGGDAIPTPEDWVEMQHQIGEAFGLLHWLDDKAVAVKKGGDDG